MNRWVMAAALVAGLAGTACAQKAGGRWGEDYAAARAEARRCGKPMLVVFR